MDTSIRNQREVEITNLLKNEHGHRENAIIEILKSTHKPEDYTRRTNREDKRYFDVKEAVRKYFLTIDEWKKEGGEEQ